MTRRFDEEFKIHAVKLVVEDVFCKQKMQRIAVKNT
uniref:Transposase n=1 Tax=Geobacillus sp. (strain Y4.1MC1) TaxID=581103 RepID=A0A7U4DJI7_GEOS0